MPGILSTAVSIKFTSRIQKKLNNTDFTEINTTVKDVISLECW